MRYLEIIANMLDMNRRKRNRVFPLGIVVLDDDEFDALERAQTEPQEPTEGIKRGAEMLRRLWPARTGATPLPPASMAATCFHGSVGDPTHNE